MARALLAFRGFGGSRGRWLDPDEVRAVLAAYGISASPSRLAASAEEAARIATEIGFPVALKLAGALVQRMAPRGVETFVGVTQEPKVGPLLGFGIGGVNVEVWRDVAFRVHPITDVDAEEMIGQIRGAKLLDGFRGGAVADRVALAETLFRVSRMVGDLPEIRELDINPLVAREPGQGVVAVDARIRMAEAAR